MSAPSNLPPPATSSANSYPPPPMYVQTARVSPEQLHFTLRPRKRGPLPPPAIELNGRVSSEVWFDRMGRLRTLLMTWEWSALEIGWLVVGIASVLIVPTVLFNTVGRRIIDNAEVQNPVVDDDSTFFVPAAVSHAVGIARAITVGAFFGLMLLFFVPYGVFKSIGRKRVRALLASFNATQPGPAGPTANNLRWSLRSVSLFGQSAVVEVTIPFHGRVSNFHPNAPLPTYMAKPAGGDSVAIAMDGLVGDVKR